MDGDGVQGGKGVGAGAGQVMGCSRFDGGGPVPESGGTSTASHLKEDYLDVGAMALVLAGVPTLDAVVRLVDAVGSDQRAAQQQILRALVGGVGDDLVKF